MALSTSFFARSSDALGKTPRTGIGLATIPASSTGTVAASAEGAFGQGAAFFFTLPVRVSR